MGGVSRGTRLPEAGGGWQGGCTRGWGGRAGSRGGQPGRHRHVPNMLELTSARAGEPGSRGEAEGMAPLGEMRLCCPVGSPAPLLRLPCAHRDPGPPCRPHPSQGSPQLPADRK